ncbi:MAG TPA: nitronate monooxygenase [Caldimonas sp.]|jgi:NAD(P)H-dependent flavin oxidoreductase YrpB (nitropropane dioxygenase family)|nr:nitronate monooxygenase [Caldimonas sp.]HEX2541452.1 nitronate monooxygenase [Caldimonas sp.]
MLKTELCRALGIEHPVFCAGIGTASGPELAAAVSNAGGCGVLGTASLPGKFVRGEIERLKDLTDRPFGVNLVLPLLRRGQVEACFDERVPILVLFWGDPAPYVDEAHRRGIKVFLQVGSVSEAIAGAQAGVDAIIAQGVEAGGHVKGTTALSVLLPTIVDAVAPLPVIGSGGIADGRGLVAALSLGAQGVSIGTRFLASTEARAADAYKARIVTAKAEDTVYTEQFNLGWANAPHRVLRTAGIERWERAGRPPAGERPDEGTVVGTMQSGGTTVDVPAYSAYLPEPGVDAEIEQMALYAGQSCSLIDAIKPAAEIVDEIVRHATDTVARLHGCR